MVLGGVENVIFVNLLGCVCVVLVLCMSMFGMLVVFSLVVKF